MAEATDSTGAGEAHRTFRDPTERPPARARVEARLVGRSAAMVRLRERIVALAPLWTPVLVWGEPGTGRDTIVRLIHETGATARGDLVRIEGRSLSAGSRLPASGALYVDGVEGLSREAQSFLAKRLCGGSDAAGGRGGGFHRSVRVLASASGPLAAREGERGFHEELARTLRRFELRVPPLRERIEDLPLLAPALLQRIGSAVGRTRIRLSSAALGFLAAQRWEENVRQLEELLARAVAFAPGPVLRRDHVKALFEEIEESLDVIRAHHTARERATLLRTLRETGGNVTRTAEALGRSRSSIYRLIDKHGIPLSRYR